jgi:hypothetical protein
MLVLVGVADAVVVVLDDTLDVVAVVSVVEVADAVVLLDRVVEVVGAVVVLVDTLGVVVVVRVPEQPQWVVRVEVTVRVTVLRVVALGSTCLGSTLAVWLCCETLSSWGFTAVDIRSNLEVGTASLKQGSESTRKNQVHTDL